MTKPYIEKIIYPDGEIAYYQTIRVKSHHKVGGSAIISERISAENISKDTKVYEVRLGVRN